MFYIKSGVILFILISNIYSNNCDTVNYLDNLKLERKDLYETAQIEDSKADYIMALKHLFAFKLLNDCFFKQPSQKESSEIIDNKIKSYEMYLTGELDALKTLRRKRYTSGHSNE